MCHEATGTAYDRPLAAEDIPLIAAHYLPRLNLTAIGRIADAIMDFHRPQPAVLVAVLEMVDRAKHADQGMYPWPMMPFSALDLDTLERVQTAAMAEFHSVFEGMALAERNMILMKDILDREFGIQFRFVHDCGCISDGNEVAILDSPAYKRINDLRALAEAIGTKVVHVRGFSDPEWLRRDLDMGPAEMRSYNRMWAILSSLPRRSTDLFGEAAAGVDYLRRLKAVPLAA